MGSFRKVWAALAVTAVIAAPNPGLAASPGVVNKAGFWAIGADGDACAATLKVEPGVTFILRGQAGQVTVALFAAKPIARGKVGTLVTDAGGFDFAPSYSGPKTLYYNGDLDAAAVAALRATREVKLLVDGQPVMTTPFEGTGFDEALDALVACSKGQNGWWGAGVATAGDTGPALNKEGAWSLQARKEVCVAMADLEGGNSLLLLAMNGGADVTVGLGGPGAERKNRGDKGMLVFDTYAVAFKPSYSGAHYMQVDGLLDPRSVQALRATKTVRITVDDRPIADAVLDGTGLPDLLVALTDCAAGKPGWWGQGAVR